jgi:hypothetical protein
MIKFFPARESLVSDIPARDEKIVFFTVYRHRKGGGGIGEKVEGRDFTREGVANTNMTDCLSIEIQSVISCWYFLYCTPLNATFRVWCLYSYSVDGPMQSISKFLELCGKSLVIIASSTSRLQIKQASNVKAHLTHLKNTCGTSQH